MNILKYEEKSVNFFIGPTKSRRITSFGVKQDFSASQETSSSFSEQRAIINNYDYDMSNFTNSDSNSHSPTTPKPVLSKGQRAKLQ